MAYAAMIICWTTAIAGGCYLVVNNHPWFALLVFLGGLSLQVSRSIEK